MDNQDLKDISLNLTAIINEIKNKYVIDIFNDTTEIICYYILRKEVKLNDLINVGNSKTITIDDLQRYIFNLKKKFLGIKYFFRNNF